MKYRILKRQILALKTNKIEGCCSLYLYFFFQLRTLNVYCFRKENNTNKYELG